MDPEIFFPEKGEANTEAVIACLGCDVRVQCEDFRRRTGSQYGIWGGKLRKRGEKDED